MTDSVFQNMADETLRRLRDFPPDEPQGKERTVAVLAATLREAFNAGREGAPGAAGLTYARVETLKSIVRMARERAQQKHEAAKTAGERVFEHGLVEAYKFVEMTIHKIEMGDFG